jgi:hypothetical protein
VRIHGGRAIPLIPAHACAMVDHLGDASSEKITVA